MRSLYICYFPITEPLVETQVLAYLRGLAAAGHPIHLLTYEVDELSPGDEVDIAAALAAQGVNWHKLRYHKRPSLLATFYDVFRGILTGLRLVRRFKIDVVHARTHVPGAMALALKAITRCALIFDIRGLMAEEYVDAGTWRKGSLAHRITTWTERKCIAAADGVIVLTEPAKQLLFDGSDVTPEGAPVVVIPSCADVDHISSQRSRRHETRGRLGWEHGRVIGYIGKFSTWYMAAEMARFFKVANDAEPSTRFVVLTQSEPELIQCELTALGVDPSHVVITKVPPKEVAAYLAGFDVGISFIRPSPSKIASSPTKIGEYLAAGIPVVVGAGIGDTDRLVTEHQVGVVITNHDDESYRRALDELTRLMDDEGLAQRCIAVAQRTFSLSEVGIPLYLSLYAAVSERLTMPRPTAEGP